MPSIAELLILQTVATHIRRHGLRSTLERAALRLLAAACGVRVLRALVLEVGTARCPSAPRELAQGFAMARAVRRFAADPANEMTPFFVADAFARGDRCYAICDGPEPLFTSWYSTRPTRAGLGDLVAHFAPRYVYLYKAFTQPAHRGRRLFAAGVGKALEQYAAKGAHGFISCIEATDFDSLKATRRMGYRDFGSVLVLQFFGRQFAWASAGCRAYHFRLENHPTRRHRPQRFHPAPAHANVPVV